MQKFRYRSSGIAAIRFSRSVSGELEGDFARALHIGEVANGRRGTERDKKLAGDLRLATGELRVELSHLANRRHPRIGTMLLH